MAKFSWYTMKEKDRHGLYVGNEVYGDFAKLRKCYNHYRPNRKGGHRHNHVKNALKRMRRCPECGEPIVRESIVRVAIQSVRGRYKTVCRSCHHARAEEIYRHYFENFHMDLRTFTWI